MIFINNNYNENVKTIYSLEDIEEKPNINQIFNDEMYWKILIDSLKGIIIFIIIIKVILGQSFSSMGILMNQNNRTQIWWGIKYFTHN